VKCIAVTGGPGGGKTTVWRELSRRHGSCFVHVPEVATLMFQHVFPPVQHELERRAVQRSIYRVQCELESVYAGRARDGQCLVTDRGTPDGGAYWPDGHIAFFAEMGTTHDAELARYDAVLFLETAAAGGHSIAEGNPTRLEDLQTAVAIDLRLREVWQSHRCYELVPQHADFGTKVERACAVLEQWLGLGE